MNKFSFISVFFAAVFILSAAVGFSQPVFTTTNLDACNASANGAITINVSSATGPTSYNIISGSFNVGPVSFTSPVTISGLAGTVAGRTYFVIVSDDNGSTPTTVVIKLYSNVSGTASATGVTTCTPFDGAIDLTPSGGAAGSGSGSYSYAWTGPSSFTATTQDISGVGPGDYNVTISDANTVCTAVLGPINVSIASPSITLGGIPGVCSGITMSTLPYSATTGSPNEYMIDWDNTANTAGLADVGFTALPATPISITGIPSVVSTTTFNGTLVARNSGTGCVTAANSISVTVTANVTPAVSISASPNGTICAGTSVTFTASPTNGGTPTYQWRKNGSNVGTNSNTYTDAALANGDQVDVVMTSSITCVTTPTATSTAITMTVTTPVVPSVSVAASPGNTICVGQSVTFTATPTNGGTPTYQWRKNGSNVGTNSNTYTDAGLANGDQVDVVMTTSLTCVTSPTATSTAITMTVTTPVTPSVSIAASPSGPICAGTSVTFTATPTNGGTPTYQWRKNGSSVGTNSNTYTDAGLANGDQVDVVMTTSLTCVTTPTATSTAITMTVTAPVTPSVTIAASPNGTICGGTNVTFTASPTNGGTPTYQWRKNGLNVGTNSNTYSDATLANGDQVDVVMTTSLTCVTSPTATSTAITMTVTTPVVPSVNIAASPNGAICAGTSVTFTATPTNGGATPTYQWTKNGLNVGTNSNTYTDAALTNGDQVVVVMTSSISCVTTPTANSNTITMTVNTPLVPSVNIAASPNGAICSGTSVTFTATPTNGGTPTYQWKKNGSNVGTNSSTYTDAALANGDQIDVVMTTSLTCVTTTTATSNTITMTVNASVTPLVSIVASPSGAICAGTSVTFTATPTSGGTPTYQWRKNGSNVGTNSGTYTDAALANGDQVDVVMTTSLACATTPTATSNLITMVVNNPVAPLVSIAASPNGTICGGTNVTFTATPTNGGGTPTYQWRKNGSNVGTNSNTYSDATLANGDQVDVTMTTSLSCVTTPTANSNTITMTVTTPLVPSVSVASSPSGAICSGTSVTFTATPTNGGTPTYQWRKNGLNVGTNSNTYTDAALANGDQIDVVMTTSLTCVTSPTATSTAITMTVSTSLTPSVSIAASPSGPICLGTSVTFTATPTNGGTPTYQWTKNGSNVGTNSNTYTDAGLANGDQVNVVMTSSLTCATTPTATTTPITMTVNNPVVPSVNVTASPSGAICAGTSVTFTAAPTNGGTPTYQWRKNGANVGTNSNTYTDAALANGDQVDVVMTTSLTCVTTPTATSAAITMTVNPLPTATISYSGGPFCATGTVSVTQTGQPGGTYSSSPSGLSIDGTTGQINLAASTGGIYTVTYTFTDGTCPNTTTTGVTVNALPTATISYSGSPFCATGTGSVTQTGQAGGTYSSTAGLVINASTGQIDLVASTPGPYTITYSFTNGTCPNTTTASITINPLPTAPTGGDVTVCFDNSLHTGTATPGAGESIVWYTAASGGSITVAPSGTAAGSYIAFAASKNNATNCESATRTQVTVTINALPVITFTTGASAICAGSSSTYTTQAGQTNYVWNVTGGTITSGGAAIDNTATIQWTNSGSVSVNYTDGNTCTAATPTSKAVTVSATPTVATAGSDQSNVCGTASLSGNAPTTGTGSWGFAPSGNVDGLGNIVTPSSPTSGFNGTPGQSYTLRWTISNGTCTPSTDDVVIAFDPTGVTPSAAGPDQSNCNSGAFTLAGNAPTSGTGQWTIVGAANGATITTPAANNSTVTGLTLGQSVTLRWSISNGASCTSTDDVILSNNNNPTVADAGSDQSACGTSVTLAANTPAVGTGAWSIVTGTGGSFVDATNPTTVFNGTQGNSYKLRWTISNGACAPSTADVNITLDQTPTTAAAGPDILNACGTIALSANNPSVGVGSWSIITNPDNLGSVANPSSNVSNFNGSPNVTYVLRWTISNGVCTNSTDDVTIQYSPTGPSTANAGSDQNICGTSTTLSGNVPGVGTGQWSFAGGGNPDGLGVIADVNNQASGFSGTAGQTYTLVWTVTNGTCTSTDQVVIQFNAAPTTSNAGPDQSLCATNTTLAANAPTSGTGIWSLSSNPDGLGVIADVNNRLSGFSGTIGQVYILTWTITSGGCTSSQDDVKISLNSCGGVCSVPVISKVDACVGNDGQINFTSVSGGTGPYSFSIDNGATWTTPPSPSYSFTGLAGGTYSTLVKDAANCTSTVNTIVIAYKVTATITKTDVTSCTASDGKITIVGQGGSGYVYSLNGGANSAPFASTTTITGLATGTYSVVIQDTGSSGCTSAPTSITISGCTIPPATNCGAFTITATDTRPTCTGQDDGTITIVVSGGAPNYVVTLSDPSLGFSQAMTGPGPFSFGTGPSGGLSPSLNYQYTVTDNASNTCTLPYSLPIQSNVKATASGFVDAQCYNQPVGQATLTVTSGGTSPYEYSLDAGTTWVSFTSPATINNLMPAAAPYSILVRDGATDQCPAQVSVTIGNAAADILITSTSADASCVNNDGSIQITSVSGGNAPYTYQFNGTSTSSLSFGTLAAGNYTFAVIDALGCTKNFPFVISSPGYADFTASVTSPSCLGGGADGKIDVQINTSGNFDIGITTDPNNDPSPFQFTSRSNISTPVTFTGLSQGTYRVVVKPNGALCSTPQTVVISTGPAAVDFDLKAMDFYCFEKKGTVKLYNIKGSTSVDYTYEIINLGNIVRTGGVTQLQTLDTVTLPLPQVGLDKGNYQVRLFQDQSAVTGCTTPISSAFKDFSINGPTLTSFDTLSVVRLQSQYSLATGSVSVTLDNTFAPKYKWMLKLVAPDITGQDNSHNSFDSQWVTPSTSIGPVSFDAKDLYAGSYQLSIRDSIGCVRTYSLNINLDSEIFIPNIFTPNNDSKNDNFEILYLPPNSKITITNRWGKQVLSGSSFPLAADGITSVVWTGGTESDGIYFYTLNTPSKTYTGWVELRR